MQIEKTYVLDFPVDQVFSAWISSDHPVAPVTRIESEPREGGSFRLYVDSEQGASIMAGRFVTFERDRNLSYTWHWGGPDQPSLVQVQFEPVDGQTRIELRHSELQEHESVANHAAGWDSYIDGLRAALADACSP